MIGDVLTCSILFEPLRKKFPDAELHFLINSHTFPVVENNPFIDKFIYFSPEIENNYFKLFSFLNKIKRVHYDVVIDAYCKVSSYLAVIFSGAELKIGYHKKASQILFDQTLKRLKKPENNTSLAIENRLRLLNPLGIEYTNVEPKIYLTESEINSAKEKLDKNGVNLNKPLFMISVLGSSSHKTYPAAYLAQLLNIIVAQKPEAQILFNYIPKQKEEAWQIYEYTSAKTQQQILFNVYGKSLREFLAITSHCNAVIGNEGGAINMGKALNRPTFIIFSPQLGKKNWFGDDETSKHKAVHLGDFINHNEEQIKEAKKDPTPFYIKFKPTYIEPALIEFLKIL